MGDALPQPLPEYLTSRDAAALLGIPERRVRQLIRDRTLVGFRAAGHWILPTNQLAQHQPGGQPPDSVAALCADYPCWRVCELSSGYAAILDAVARRVSGFCYQAAQSPPCARAWSTGTTYTVPSHEGRVTGCSGVLAAPSGCYSLNALNSSHQSHTLPLAV